MSLYGKLVAMLVLGLIGVAGGAWFAAQHFRPRLEAANLEAARCAERRSTLEQRVMEQNRRLGELALSAQLREQAATRALRTAQAEADAYEANAQRLLAGHNDGEDCAVARQLIDRELALPTHSH
ncbi:MULTISPECIES: hypothetical protein [Pseudomonas]|uniref:hypothetical protein n=1 Tax=Pseudomonas TaxID=286 RepID=UPI0023D8687A|nr:hypothetical protein [Pseudomonas sp. 273]